MHATRGGARLVIRARRHPLRRRVLFIARPAGMQSLLHVLGKSANFLDRERERERNHGINLNRFLFAARSVRKMPARVRVFLARRIVLSRFPSRRRVSLNTRDSVLRVKNILEGDDYEAKKEKLLKIIKKYINLNEALSKLFHLNCRTFARSL